MRLQRVRQKREEKPIGKRKNILTFQKLSLAFLFVIFLTLFFHFRSIDLEWRTFYEQLTSSAEAIFGSFFLSLTFAAVSILYFRINHRHVVASLQKCALLVAIVVLSLLFAKGTELAVKALGQQAIGFLRFPIFIPFTALLISLLVGREISLFVSSFVAIVLCMTVAKTPDSFLITNLIAALVTILSARYMRRRKEVFLVCLQAWMATAAVVFGYHLVKGRIWNVDLGADLAMTFAYFFVTALLVVAVLPVLEWMFKVMTDIKLMEYMDPQNVLLSRLSLEAPGTYQHSLVIGNLAERAAVAVGASGLFCRISALYHDIGKLSNPRYFAENQMGGFNMHQLLTPQESANVIIEHIQEGELLAKKHNLPESFIDIIKQHHGTTLVYYFYCRAKQQDPIFNEQEFRYPGPKPQTREAAIMMIADAVEAASRCLDEVTEESIHKLIEEIVEGKISDGQFDECPLTFKELKRVKEILIKTLLIASHLRVKYQPRVKEKESILEPIP